MLSFFKRKLNLKSKADEDPPERKSIPHHVDTFSQKMIQNIVDLNGTTVKEIMIPRIDMIAFSIQEPVATILPKIVESGLSRIPVYHGTIDEIIGILYVKDLIPYIQHLEDVDFKKVVRSVFFVPESKRINALLQEFQAKKIHMAVIIDEYGGVAGLVTLEDILEEIVGEIQDEYDEDEEESYIRLSEHSYLVDTRLTLEEVNESLPITIEDEESDTLGGYIYGLFGKVPECHEVISMNDIDYEVMEIDGNRISKVKITINNPIPTNS